MAATTLTSHVNHPQTLKVGPSREMTMARRSVPLDGFADASSSAPPPELRLVDDEEEQSELTMSGASSHQEATDHSQDQSQEAETIRKTALKVDPSEGFADASSSAPPELHRIGDDEDQSELTMSEASQEPRSRDRGNRSLRLPQKIHDSHAWQSFRSLGQQDDEVQAGGAVPSQDLGCTAMVMEEEDLRCNSAVQVGVLSRDWPRDSVPSHDLGCGVPSHDLGCTATMTLDDSDDWDADPAEMARLSFLSRGSSVASSVMSSSLLSGTGSIAGRSLRSASGAVRRSSFAIAEDRSMQEDEVLSGGSITSSITSRASSITSRAGSSLRTSGGSPSPRSASSAVRRSSLSPPSSSSNRSLQSDVAFAIAEEIDRSMEEDDDDDDSIIELPSQDLGAIEMEDSSSSDESSKDLFATVKETPAKSSLKPAEKSKYLPIRTSKKLSSSLEPPSSEERSVGSITKKNSRRNIGRSSGSSRSLRSSGGSSSRSRSSFTIAEDRSMEEDLEELDRQYSSSDGSDLFETIKETEKSSSKPSSDDSSVGSITKKKSRRSSLPSSSSIRSLRSSSDSSRRSLRASQPGRSSFVIDEDGSIEDEPSSHSPPSKPSGSITRRNSSRNVSRSSSSRWGALQTSSRSQSLRSVSGIVRSSSLPMDSSSTRSLQPSSTKKNMFETIVDTKMKSMRRNRRSTFTQNFHKAEELQLTSEEKYENAKWRMRQQDRKVFQWDYRPVYWEKREREEIGRFLSLTDPSKEVKREYDEYDYEEPQDSEEAARSDATKEAIRSIFFPKKTDCESILLKRGGVLVGGHERELMAFTYGFVLGRVELGSLVNLLLNTNNGEKEEEFGEKKDEELTLENIADRFVALDADGSGTLDKSEIRACFRSSGIVLSDKSLDTLMRRLDKDNSGEISVDEFKDALLKEVGGMIDDDDQPLGGLAGFSWSKLGAKFKRVVATDGVTRKLDAVFLTTDVERIEQLVHTLGKKAKKLKDRALGYQTYTLAQKTFAIHLRGVESPLVVTCAKPGHVEYWMETFAKCIGALRIEGGETLEDEKDWRTTGVIQGLDPAKRRTSCKCVERWRGGSVDWGIDDDFEVGEETMMTFKLASG